MSVIRAKLTADADGSLRLTVDDPMAVGEQMVELEIAEVQNAEDRQRALKAFLDLPPLSIGEWPEGFTCSRSQLYGEGGA